jgi:hypothetical protein
MTGRNPNVQFDWISPTGMHHKTRSVVAANEVNVLKRRRMLEDRRGWHSCISLPTSATSATSEKKPSPSFDLRATHY